jgi:hypothetical protein
LLVKAKETRDKALPAHLQAGMRDGTDDPRFPIKVGKAYVVYGVGTWGQSINYAICDEHYPERWYPVMYPAPLFEIVDGGVPSCWRFSWESRGEGPSWRESFLLAFPEWSNDPSYYERLFDKDEAAVAVFETRKAEIDAQTE